jgi:hypothetical protein
MLHFVAASLKNSCILVELEVAALDHTAFD